ncbi:MAG: hypothetical protein LBH46_03305 [Rickettsiales bacterium]|jgi:exonuclease VII small subunit|nr:hypothetical protein [Rickettsiales bacterium]
MEKISELSFEESASELESILDALESTEITDDPKIGDLLETARLLKEHCDNLLDKEKREIVEEAKRSGVKFPEGFEKLTDFSFIGRYDDDEDDERPAAVGVDYEVSEEGQADDTRRRG